MYSEKKRWRQAEELRRRAKRRSSPGMWLGARNWHQRFIRNPAKPLSRIPLYKDERALFRSLYDGLHGGPIVPRDARIGVVKPVEPSSRLESLSTVLLEKVCKHLTDADLCTLSQANSYCEYLFCKDDFWKWRAEAKQIPKVFENQSWKWNYMAAEMKHLYSRPLSEAPVFFQGEVTVIDPQKIFFIGNQNAIHLVLLKYMMQSHMQRNRDFVITYRGEHAAFVISRYWDSDTAFEITRDGLSLGVDEASSKFIAAIPRKLVDILVAENNARFEGGVSIQDVEGQFRSSGDGDFVITRPTPHPRPTKLARWIQDEVANADVICAAGGSWTFCEDSSSSDEDDDDLLDESREFTEEEVERILAEKGEIDLMTDYGVM